MIPCVDDSLGGDSNFRWLCLGLYWRLHTAMVRREWSSDLGFAPLVRTLVRVSRELSVVKRVEDMSRTGPMFGVY